MDNKAEKRLPLKFNFLPQPSSPRPRQPTAYQPYGPAGAGGSTISEAKRREEGTQRPWRVVDAELPREPTVENELRRGTPLQAS